MSVPRNSDTTPVLFSETPAPYTVVLTPSVDKALVTSTSAPRSAIVYRKNATSMDNIVGTWEEVKSLTAGDQEVILAGSR